MACNIIFQGIEYTRKEFEQLLSPSQTKASPETLSKIRTFLDRIGVDEKAVQNIVVNGEKIGASGVANILNRLIQVVDGKQDVALTEEAMHFAVEILEQTNSKLFSSLFNKVGKYSLYSSTLTQYRSIYTNRDGSSDIRKIKKEAIAKVLAEYIINQNEGTVESAENIAQAKNWWDQIVSFLKSLFRKAEFNPFAEVASSVLNNTFEGTAANLSSTDNYFQLSEAQQIVVDNLRKTQQEINKIVTEKTEDQDARNEYRVVATGEVVPNRVSSLSKESYDRTFGAGKQKEREASPLSIWASTTGTNGHGEVEDIIARWVDSEGKLLTSPISPAPSTTRLGSTKFYTHIENKVLEILREYPEGTIFLPEQVIYDADYTPKIKKGEGAKRGIAGTVDLIAIKPDGETDILDWKFQVSLIERGTNLIKVGKYEIQIGEYKRILKEKYGVNKFNRLRVIPGSINYEKKGGEYNLISLKLGGTTIEQEQALLPVPMREEMTGIPEMDALLKHLYDLYDELTNTKRTAKNRVYLNNKALAIFKAIQDFKVKNSFKQFSELMDIQTGEYSTLLEELKNFSSTDNEQINNFSRKLNGAFATIPIYLNANIIFRNSEMSEEDRTSLLVATDKMSKLLEDLKIASQQFAQNSIIAPRVDGANFEEIERSNKSFFNTFNVLSKQGLISLNTLRAMDNEITNRGNREFLRFYRRINNVQKGLEQWSKGKKRLAYMELVEKKNNKGERTNTLIDQYDEEFYTTLEKKVEEVDVAWIKENIDIEKFKQLLEKNRVESLDAIENGAYFGTEEEIAQRKDEALTELNLRTNLNKKEAFLNNIYLLKKAPSDKWFSKEYKTLLENEPVLQFWQMAVEINNMAVEEGYISKFEAERGFMPFIQASLSQKVAEGNFKFRPIRSFIEAVSIDEKTVGYGAYNKITNKIENVIPRYFRNIKEGEDLSDYSRDGIVNLALFAEAVIDYKYTFEREEQAKLLLYIEKNLKQALPVDRWGNVTSETPVSNDINAALIDKYIKNVIYGQKYPDQEDVAFGNPARAANKGIEWINKKTGLKIATLPSEWEDNRYSLARILDFANRAFSLKVLGINIGSSISQFLGGNFQALISAGKYYNRKDFRLSEQSMLTRAIFKKDELHLAAILEFMPVEGEFKRQLLGLSGSKLSKTSLADILMTFMRAADLSVQYASFGAMLRNAIVVDGRVVNAREYVRSTPEYKAAYQGGQMAEFQSKFDEIVDDLIERQGLINQISVSKEGEIVFPEGIDMNSLDNYKTLIRSLGMSAAGGILPGNEMPIRMTVLGNSMMVFKNWIPGLVAKRMQGFKYDQDTRNWEWGRYKTFGSYLSWNLWKAGKEVAQSIRATKEGIEKMTTLYQQKKEEYRKRTGKELVLTKEEFFDLVRQNLKSQIKELLILAALLSAFIVLKQLAPDDEDKEIRGFYNYSLRTMDKISDEILFFYNPISFQSLLSGNMFPAIGVLTDMEKFLFNFGQEAYGTIFTDEEMKEDAHPAKYFMRSFPATKELLNYLSIFSPEFAKSMGVNINPNYGSIR